MSQHQDIESLRAEIKSLKSEVKDLKEFIKIMYGMIGADGDDEYGHGDDHDMSRYNT